MATLFEGACGFAFEVDEEEVGLGAEQLAEVIVAVDADALAEAGWVAVDGLYGGEESVAVGKEFGGEVEGLWAEGCGGVLEGGLEGVEGGGGLAVDALAIAGEVFGGGGLGGEGWVAGGRGQG